MKRTDQQNKAIHVFFTLLSDALNDAGYDQRRVLKESIEIPWTPIAIKSQLWKPIMESMTGQTSTTQMEKQQHIEKIHATLMRHLGEKFEIDYIPFPHLEKKSDLLEAQKIHESMDYPDEEVGEDKF